MGCCWSAPLPPDTIHINTRYNAGIGSCREQTVTGSEIAADQRREATVPLSAGDIHLFDAVDHIRNDRDAAAAAVQQAIRDGANVNAVRGTDGYYVTTPLFEACQRGCDEIVRILLNAGADTKWKKDYDGWSAITIVCSNGPLSTVQLLLNQDYGILEMTDNLGWTPLFHAVCGQHSEIVQLLLDSGADVHCADRSGETALMTACRCDNLEIVRLLLAAGVDVEARGRRQQTALHYAASRGNIEIVRELILQHNASIFAVGNGRTPFDRACDSNMSGADIDCLLEMYTNKLTQDHGRFALHELLKVAKYSFAEGRRFHPPVNPLQIILPLGKLALKHFRTLLHNLDPELIRNRDDTGKLPIHIACQTNAPVDVLALISELDPTTLHIADSTGALPIHLFCGNATAATEYASVRYLIKSFPGSVAVQTNAGDYPFMMAAAAESSSASLSVIYELVRAVPGLAVPR